MTEKKDAIGRLHSILIMDEIKTTYVLHTVTTRRTNATDRVMVEQTLSCRPGVVLDGLIASGIVTGMYLYAYDGEREHYGLVKDKSEIKSFVGDWTLLGPIVLDHIVQHT